MVHTLGRLAPVSNACTCLVEVYGSLLNSEERKEFLKHGKFEEVGKVKRVDGNYRSTDLAKTDKKPYSILCKQEIQMTFSTQQCSRRIRKYMKRC